MIAVLLLVFMAGCTYVVNTEEKKADDGITPINISEILESSSESEDTSDSVEETSAKTEESASVKEIPTIKVTEGDLVSFPNLKAVDPDGDKLTYTFSAPLDVKGKWQTKEGDAGEKTVTITVSDGKSEVKQEVMIIVNALNKAPVLEKLQDVVVKEGQTVKLSPKAIDPEGKDVAITYSGWMNSDTKSLDYNSAGSYIVRVTASDGVHSVYQDVKITVEDVNRAPEFVKVI